MEVGARLECGHGEPRRVGRLRTVQYVYYQNGDVPNITIQDATAM